MYKMNTNNEKQNRREFLKSATRNTVISGLGLLGISLGYKSLSRDPEKICAVHLPCRNCFKLGNCNEDEALKMRSSIKKDRQSDTKNKREI